MCAEPMHAMLTGAPSPLPGWERQERREAFTRDKKASNSPRARRSWGKNGGEGDEDPRRDRHSRGMQMDSKLVY
jgi:hypothetical protein